MHETHRIPTEMYELRGPASGKIFRLPTVSSADTISATKYSSTTTPNADSETSSYATQISRNSISCSQDPCTSTLTTVNLGPGDISERPANPQPLSSVADTIKSPLALFDYQKLYVHLRSLITQLQESEDPITKLVAIIDTVIACLSTSNHP